MSGMDEMSKRLEAALTLSTPFPTDSQPAASDVGSTTPALPGHMASARQHTADEVLAMMNKTPLFMTELPDGIQNDDSSSSSKISLSNPELEAIRALKYEGTRSEIAQNFREQGNEMARAKRWRDSREFYTKALEALRHEPGKTEKAEDGGLSDEEKGKERAIEEACYANRALCNLNLQNYRLTLTDTATTLRMNPTSQKALYRSALALFSLHHLPLALDACEKGLNLSSSSNTEPDPSLLALKHKITIAIAKEEAKISAAREKAKKEQMEKQTLAMALKKRGIQLMTSSGAEGNNGHNQQQQQTPPDLEDATIQLEDPLDAESPLSFPLLLLFPLAAQSDFVKSVVEDTLLQEVLEMVLPPPWDVDQNHDGPGGGLYNVPAAVEVYAERRSSSGGGGEKRGLVKLGRKMTVGKVLATGGVEIQDGMMKVFVVPKGEKAAAWVEQMKVRMGR